jgi:peroxiredoxin (alkyl hydroperoxide reductase subunit C)
MIGRAGRPFGLALSIYRLCNNRTFRIDPDQTMPDSSGPPTGRPTRSTGTAMDTDRPDPPESGRSAAAGADDPGLPRIGEPAPEFTARSTHGPCSLSDYRGRWLLFLSHPADFTPVCTSEFVALARAADAFAGRGCDLLALSADSVFAHLAWLRSIREAFGVDVGFPIVEDPSMAIARAYGMIHPQAGDTATIRASFAIDPEGIVQALVYYPMQVGRSVPELLRLLDALQAARRGGLSTPADWQPGQPALASPARTVQDADRAAAQPDAPAWYYRPVTPRDDDEKA